MNYILLVFILSSIFSSLIAGQTIKANVSHIKTAEPVNVAWFGISPVNKHDLVGLWPVGANASSYLFSHYASDFSNWDNGEGNYSELVINMRSPMEYRYYSLVDLFYKLVAKSEPITVEENLPMQVHLSTHSNPTEMIVTWVSASNKNGTVAYGQSPTSLDSTVQGRFSTYKLSDLCYKTPGGEASQTYWINPGQIHSATMKNLKQNTKYYYQVTNGNAKSRIFDFVSLPGQRGNFKFIALADMGTDDTESSPGESGPGSLETTNQVSKFMKSETYQLFNHIGDLSYARGNYYSCYAARWEQFFYQIEDIASQLPYMVSVGNHEYDYIGQPFTPSWGHYADSSGGECGVPYNRRFNMPKNGNKNYWYSYEVGMVHFVVASTEQDFEAGSPQYKWISNDLASVDRTKTPWIIFMNHRPMYSSTDYGPQHEIGEHMRVAYEPLLLKNKVNLVLVGHMHNYERSCPVFNGTCMGTSKNPKAPMHVVIGSAGAGLFGNWNSQPNWSIFRVSQYGFITVDVKEKQLYVQFRGSRFGAIHDEFSLSNYQNL